MYGTRRSNPAILWNVDEWGERRVLPAKQIIKVLYIVAANLPVCNSPPSSCNLPTLEPLCRVITDDVCPFSIFFCVWLPGDKWDWYPSWAFHCELHNINNIQPKRQLAAKSAIGATTSPTDVREGRDLCQQPICTELLLACGSNYRIYTRWPSTFMLSFSGRYYAARCHPISPPPNDVVSERTI